MFSGFGPSYTLYYFCDSAGVYLPSSPFFSFFLFPSSPLAPHTHFSYAFQQQRKERDMVRQQDKGAPRRLEDLRRDEDRRMAEREQVSRGPPHWSSARPGGACVVPNRSHPTQSLGVCERDLSLQQFPWQQFNSRAEPGFVKMSSLNNSPPPPPPPGF